MRRWFFSGGRERDSLIDCGSGLLCRGGDECSRCRATVRTQGDETTSGKLLAIVCTRDDRNAEIRRISLSILPAPMVREPTAMRDVDVLSNCECPVSARHLREGSVVYGDQENIRQ